MEYTIVTCGECGGNATFVYQGTPLFYWCRYCQCVFRYAKTFHTAAAKWQLRGYPQS